MSLVQEIVYRRKIIHLFIAIYIKIKNFKVYILFAAFFWISNNDFVS